MPKKAKTLPTPTDDTVAKVMGFPSYASLPRHLRWREGSCMPRLTPHDLLPGFDLFDDPSYPPQPLAEFRADADRRVPRASKNVIYVVVVGEPQAEVPIATIAAYVDAFYSGVVTRVLPPLPLVPWNPPRGKAHAPSAAAPVAVRVGDAAVRVRSRACGDKCFVRQLNLNDVIDGLLARMEDLPDAFAIVGVTSEDLFESKDDEFTMGRSYGGSGVAVISTARDKPSLDSRLVPTMAHTLPPPSSSSSLHRKRSRAGDATPTQWSFGGADGGEGGASASARHGGEAAALADATWLFRVCGTVVHELGHCFGIDHCTYFKCYMQGSASLTEARTQPPYACPLELAKLCESLGWGEAHLHARDESLLAVLSSPALCVANGAAGYAAWIRQRRRETAACGTVTAAA